MDNRTNKTTKAMKVNDSSGEMISIDECREYLKGYKLTDSEMKMLRNSLAGIIDSLISSYLDDFM